MGFRAMTTIDYMLVFGSNNPSHHEALDIAMTAVTFDMSVVLVFLEKGVDLLRPGVDQEFVKKISVLHEFESVPLWCPEDTETAQEVVSEHILPLNWKTYQASLRIANFVLTY